MPFVYDITKDLRYLEGFRRGFAKGFEQGFKRGLSKQILVYLKNSPDRNHSPQEIAHIFDLSLEFAENLLLEAKEANT